MSAEAALAAAASPRWRALVPLVAWPLAFVALAAGLQLLQSSPFDGDTAYHVAVARLTREHGILHAFPWTPFSWLADHYADKEELFHLLLAPLSGLDWIAASRIAGTVLGGALLTVLWLVLRRERVRWAGLWVVAALVSSGYFAVRFAIVRPHLLSIPLALAISWAAARRRLGVLFVLSLVYPLCYVGWHVAFGLAVLAELARLLAGERPSWKAPAVAAGGLALGVLIHPNFPAIVQLFWIQNARILFGAAWSGAAGVELGPEFAPYDLRTGALYLTIPLLLLLAAVPLAWRSRRRDALPLAFAIAAVGWMALTLRTARFIEYSVPFSFAAFALAWRDAGLGWLRAAPAAAAAAGLALTGTVGRELLDAMRITVEPISPALVRELQPRIPAGAQVMTCDWFYTGNLLLHLPGRRYVVGLDPMFFRVRYPELYDRWFEIVHRPPWRPAAELADRFGASWVLCEARPQYIAFIDALAKDPLARLAVWDGSWAAFEIRRPAGRAGSDAR